MKTEEINPRHKRLTFEDINDLVTFSGKHAPGSSMWGSPEYNSFYMTETPEEACELALRGWGYGLDNVALNLDKIKKGLPANELQYQYDVTGDVLDVGIYLSGEPECWLEQQPLPARPFLKIIIHSGFSSSVTSEQILKRGAGIAALVDTLSEKYNVEVWSYSQSVSRDRRICEVFVKITNTPLDLDALTFALCHPSFFRRIVTGAIDVAFGCEDIGTWHPEDLAYEQRQGRDIIYFQNLKWDSSDWRTPESSAQRIKEIINGLENGTL